MRGRQDVVAFAPRVEELHAPVGVQPPAQYADVGGGVAGPEDREQPAVRDAQAQQPRAPVVAVQPLELPDESGVVQQSGPGVVRQGGQSVAGVQREDVADLDLPAAGRPV